MLKKLSVTWIVATIVFVVATLVIERAFRLHDPRQIVPLAQAAGLWLAWLVAWPYTRAHRRMWSGTGFVWYAGSMFVPAVLVAALRIAFKTG
jgi:hypothetical protein